MEVDTAPDVAVPPLRVVSPVARTTPSELPRVPIAIPGASIPADASSVSGHGTYIPPSSTPDGRNAPTATVAGIVERVNRLVVVRPLRSRYTAEKGDVVIGRVVELAHGKWKLDINARFDADLQLGAVNLPGGVHRRRNEEDILNMRKVYKEGDLVSAEVQTIRDFSISLQNRSLRYGKLTRGQFITVQASLIKRAKRHFHTLPCGVHIILGNNGYIFLSIVDEDTSKRTDHHATQERSHALDRVQPTVQQRQIIARVRNAILALDLEFIAISPETISEVYGTSLQRGIDVQDMLDPGNTRVICNEARELRAVA